MRAWLFALSLLAVTLGGCAETNPIDGADTPASPDGSEPVANVNETTSDLPTFTVVTIVNETVDAGMPFDITIQTTLPEEMQANATWTIEAFNVTQADSSNATAANETADNATSPAPVAFVSGTGVPSTATLNLTDAANHTLKVTVEVAGYETGSEEVMIAVLGGGVAAFDAAPEPLIFEGTVSGRGPNVGLADCQTADQTFTFSAGRYQSMKFIMAVDDSETGADLDWSISGPGGEAHSSDAVGTEAPKSFDLPSPGEWGVTVVCFTSWQSNDFTITAEFQ
jgi:hypothetical protein